MPRKKPGEPRKHPIADPLPIPDFLEPAPVIGETAQPRTIIDTKNRKFICGVWRPRKGAHCLSTLLYSCGRCKVHGGGSPRGEDSPHYKSGRRSKYSLPAKLQDRYNDSLSDPELISLRRELALTDVRIQSLLDKLNASACLERWSKCRAVFDELAEKAKAGDLTAVLELLEQVKVVTAEGDHDEGIWRDIQEAIESKTRVAAAEWKRLADTDRLVTVEQAIDIMGTVMHTVMDIVTDDAQKRKIRDAVRGYINSTGGVRERNMPVIIDPVFGLSSDEPNNDQVIEIPPPSPKIPEQVNQP